ncbi:MAG: alpha/beta hydrolase [Oscillospiraceae bacterium]|jgi:acetyl esterase/lipase|nr:alpha/beta hydrolase [Oscillospiraceae bacterium]
MKTVRFNPNPDSQARAVGYLHDVYPEEMPNRLKRPCVVVFPGGGYAYLSEREADPPAMAFFSKGYNVFILYYSIQEHAKDFTPLVDGSLTMLKIRGNSEKWGILPDKIAVCGFSAGAHAAASLGTLWDASGLKEKIDIQGGKNRPNAMILCYPVITMGQYAHLGSAETVCGGDLSEEKVNLFSLEKHVNASTPPTFLWHTYEDGAVPLENTLLFAEALRRQGIPFEYHVFQKGGHGMSLCNDEVGTPNSHAAAWFPLCAEWLGDLFGFTY